VELAVGRVIRPHGLRGELVVEVRTDEPDERFAVGSTLDVRKDTGEPRTVTVKAVRPHGGRLVVRFEGVADRTAADGLRGALLTVDSETLSQPADPDEYYDHQLVGLTVELAAGGVVGTVADVVHAPGGELLVVARDGGAEALIPFVRDIVPTVDLDAGRMVIDPPEGLLD
jgi:16S rRNA processing protein RimM